MSMRRPPFLPLALILGGVILGNLDWQVASRRAGKTVSIEEIHRKGLAPGQVVRIERADLHNLSRLRVNEYDHRDPKGDRAYSFGVIQDPDTGRRMAMLYWRSTFPDARLHDTFTRASVRGTLRAFKSDERDKVLAALRPPFAGPEELELYLDDMEFPPMGVGPIAGALLALGMLAAGIVMLVRGDRPLLAVPARSSGAAPALSAGRAGASRKPTAAEMLRTCGACAAEFPGSSRNCLVCKAPVEIEYFVAAALPFEGFDRYVPVLTGMLKVGEYQATQPLARVHTPYPYQHLDGFHAKGPASNATLRLTGRGIPSLVTARAVAAAIKEKGVESVVVGSDELMHGPFPRAVSEVRFDEDEITFIFYSGPDREERVVRWSRIGLVLFSAALQLRGTMTLAREVKESQPAEASSYLIDLYERDNPEGIRIAEHTFHRWEFLKTGGSERTGDRFGKLIELLEANARDADIQYITGAYRGPKSEWRMNFYSRMAFLAAMKAGWSKTEGPPRLEGYEVLEKIGEGGMGAVYKARQKKLGRVVALKVISPHLAAHGTFVKRFQAEARAVAQLAHPNIVQVIDLAESGGRHFMAMEFIEGRTLLGILKDRRRLGELEGLRVCLDVARALDHAARRGILHRDVKPENIFISKRNEVKLGDWGLAKDLEQDMGLTDTGTTVGTPYYMSPEQARASKSLDYRSDLYSLGATLYHLVTGQPPFRGGSPMEVIAKHLQSPAPDPRTLAPELGAESAELMLRLLRKRPEERCKDAAEVIAALEHAIASCRRSEVVLT